MDETDQQILKILKKNSRMSYIDIAEKVDLSEGAVRKRIDNLKKDGVIKRFTIETSAQTEGLVIIRIDPAKTREAAKEVKNYAERVYELSGEWDVVAWLYASDIRELNEKVDKIREISGILDTSTLIKMKEH